METEKNKATILRIYDEVWNKGNIAVVDELFAVDFHAQSGSEHFNSRAGFKDYVAAVRAAFPDFTISAEIQIAEGDKVVTRWLASGTHKGMFMGIAPTGKQVKITGISINRFVGGKVAEGWQDWDALGLMKQLGVIP